MLDRLQRAEEYIEALRREEVDAVIGRENILVLSLQKMQRQLHLSEERYRSIVENQSEFVCRRTPDGVITFVNEAYGRFFGHPRAELIGRRFDPAGIDADAGAPGAPIGFKGPDGTIVPTEFECRAVIDGRHRWIRWIEKAIVDEHGQPFEIQCVGRDITRQKEDAQTLQSAHIELAATVKALEDVNRELSEYSAAVTCEIKEQIRAVLNYAAFLHEDLEGELKEEQQQYLDGLKTAASRGHALVEDLKSFAQVGKHPEECEAVDLDRLVKETIAAQHLRPVIDVVVPDAWPELEVQPTLLKMILGQLISNAVKFNTSDKKRIEVGWQHAAAGRIEIFVRDNGIGIDAKLQHLIFGIFKRLHVESAGEGTGIGLAIAGKAARLLGGTLRCDSVPGTGSTFTLDLPSVMSPRS